MMEVTKTMLLGALARDPETASASAAQIPENYDVDVITAQEHRNRPKRKRGDHAEVAIAEDAALLPAALQPAQ